MKTATQLTKSFMTSRAHRDWDMNQQAWLRTTFGALLKVARRNREFTMDDIWEEMDRIIVAGKMPRARIDHRILGPMIRHMVSEGLVGSSGYYVKSTRTGGGSRPVTIWDSYMTDRVKVAA